MELQLSREPARFAAVYYGKLAVTHDLVFVSVPCIAIGREAGAPPPRARPLADQSRDPHLRDVVNVTRQLTAPWQFSPRGHESDTDFICSSFRQFSPRGHEVTTDFVCSSL